MGAVVLGTSRCDLNHNRHAFFEEQIDRIEVGFSSVSGSKSPKWGNGPVDELRHQSGTFEGGYGTRGPFTQNQG